MSRYMAVILCLLFSCPAFSQTSSETPSAKSHTIQTVYIMPSSHWDLGFLAPPEQILPRLKPHIDEVIANAKADPEFRWTIESVWQLREWLSRTHDPEQIKDFVALVNKGQIQVSAVFGSMHTEFMGAEALNRITYDMQALQKDLGIKTDFAMMDDVPGFTLRLPQILARSGVRYFVNGSNLFIGGGTSLSPGQVPFYWQSPDGSSVLTWQTQSRFGGYTEAMADYYLDPLALEPYTKEHFYPKEWEGQSRLEIMQRGMDKLLEKYEKATYPYDAVLVLDLHDFVSSNLEAKQLLPGVREWNAAGKQPHIVVCTPAEFFKHMESQYGKDRFASYGGDWSGLWSEVKTNSPATSANARWLNDHWPVAETLWSLLTFRTFTSLPAGNLEDTRLKFFKFDEHSGAGQVGWPKLMSRAEVDQQNKEYVDYTASGRTDTEYLIRSGLQTLLAQKPAAKPVVTVFNPLSWQRTEVVHLQSKDDLTLRDPATGKTIPTQRISGDEVGFLAQDVPSIGYRTYVIENRAAPRAIVHDSATEIENSFYRVKIRSSDGAIVSWFDKQLNFELVDSNAGKALNQLVRWSPVQTFPAGTGAISIERDSGPVFDRLTIRRPGTYWPESSVILYRDTKRVEVANLLDRDRMPFVASNQPGEYYSFDFPLNFHGSSQVWIENGIGFHRTPQDYLPGARTDAAVPQHALVLAGSIYGRPVAVTLSQRESFFDYLPGLPAAKGPNTFLNNVRATVMRKQDQGDTRDLGMVNFATVEPGLSPQSSYHFSLSSQSGEIDSVSSYREGLAFDVPLVATELAGAMSPAEMQSSYFSVSARNVVLLAFKPSTDANPEHYTVRLQEIAGKPAEVDLHTPLKVTAAEKTSMTETERVGSLPAAPVHVSVAPFETVTLRLTIPHPHKQRSERWWEWD